ncbi:MAG: FeS assembly SUF system protein [Bacteroidetes bacterium GWF2_43_63]|nr:MAG: FeS assembly SUF system protein [Bacteroidetes bacterium GWE2_42_42]OFY54359.1 MAG: FeS assembly SUF system protein [Bacteroidetes bacterium GWF2_43_63]HBG69251.1 FeS assembly SUF system protein [Bacteroidales bacterium]HCB61193.1 FeS assembly SUF system protein [Bacteroidales bacterium]HCY24113.1 FeS assembly SUF system protein [Bacteroidales bacterium]
MDTTSPMVQEIISRIKTVFDPEIPVNIWDMGMIYDITVDAEMNAKILMTVTAPNCPVADTLPIEVKTAVEYMSQLKSVWVELTFDPPWDPDRLSDEAKLELGLL